MTSPESVAREIVVVEPTCPTQPKADRERQPWCVRVFRTEVSRQITQSRAESYATRLRTKLIVVIADAERRGRDAATACYVRSLPPDDPMFVLLAQEAKTGRGRTCEMTMTADEYHAALAAARRAGAKAMRTKTLALFDDFRSGVNGDVEWIEEHIRALPAGENEEP